MRSPNGVLLGHFKHFHDAVQEGTQCAGFGQGLAEQVDPGVAVQVALPATLLVRAATLWFAVLLGLTVTLIGRRRLHWSEVREEAARGQ